MENGMIENGTIATVMAARRWLTLEQLLEVLPLKKSYVYYLTHTRQIPVTRIPRRSPKKTHLCSSKVTRFRNAS